MANGGSAALTVQDPTLTTGIRPYARRTERALRAVRLRWVLAGVQRWARICLVFALLALSPGVAAMPTDAVAAADVVDAAAPMVDVALAAACARMSGLLDCSVGI